MSSMPGTGSGVLGSGSESATPAGAGVWAGSFGGATLTPVGGPVGLPGESAPVGNPYETYPQGMEQRSSIDCSATSTGAKYSGVAIVPRWAVSFDIRVESDLVIGATFAARVTEAAPTGNTYLPFATDVTLSKAAGYQAAIKRGNPCSPGRRLRLELTTGTASADDAARVTFVFTPAATLL